MAFLVAVVATLALIHGYVGLRIIPTLVLTASWTKLLWIALGLLAYLPLALMIARYLGAENRFTDTLSWLAFTSLGFFFLTFLAVLVRDLGWVLWAGGAKLAGLVQHLQAAGGEPPDPFDPGRRQFIIQAMNLGILGLTGGLSAYGIVQARRKPIIEEVTVPIAGLPAGLEGFRIAQISDLHIGPTIKAAFVQTVVEQVQALKADMIALTGDLVDGSVDHLSGDVAPLAALEAPYGKFFITGNHEYYAGVEHWVDEVARLGFTNLLNEHQVLNVGGAQLTVAGVTDLHAHQVHPPHRTDPDKALAGAPADSIKLLLAHQPGSIFDARRLGVHLQLSGHTHGGQMRPFDYVVAKAHPYLRGLHDHDGTWIYVNRGTGYWGPPLRLGVPSEITLLRLTAA